MTFSPRPCLSAASLSFVLTLAVVGLASSGCEDKHIGRPCDLSAQDAGVSGTGNNATINSQAVECPSRICLQPAADKNIGSVKPLCTADCSSDDDCDGETGGKGSGLCTTGFVCMVPTTVGDFCCRKMCVCKDLVEIPTGGFKTPEVCKPGQTMCHNVH